MKTFSTLLILLFLTCCSPGTVKPTDGDKSLPNIIILYVDDLGYGDVGEYGAAGVLTPNIDRLARGGLKFTDAYSTAATCSPSRYSLLTGRYAFRRNASVLPGDAPLMIPAGSATIASMLLQRAGYRTAVVGKWHLGHSQQTYHPNERGFDDFYGHLHTEVGYFPPFAAQGGRDFQRNGVSINDEGYETFLMGDEASRWIRDRDKAKPFFLYVPFLAPHTPLDAPADLQEKYADLVDDRAPTRSRESDRSRMMGKLTLRPSARPMYAAVVDAMDQAIAQILDTLDEQGIADNTIVLFFSDNGGAAYATGGADNAPLRGGKGDTFEGGIRVVSVMRWPQEIPAGEKFGEISSVMDVFPTLAGAAGVTPGSQKDLDGRNLWPAIQGQAEPPALDDYLFFASETPIRGSFSFTAFNEEWKLVQEIRQGFLSADVTNFLFRIDEDPHERNNLAMENPSVVARMSDALQRWRLLYPVSGTRSELVPPPGWRAPLDWATYPRPVASLRPEPAPGMPPEGALAPLDWMHGEGGRLIYDCEPWGFLQGGLCR